MKTKHVGITGKSIVAATVLLAVAVSFGAVTFPPNSTLEVQPGAGTNIVKIKISDANDYVWILQSSSNLTSWMEVEALKIHNGNFQRAISRNLTLPNLFFRTYYDPNRQNIFSATDSALHLPSTAFNYAAPLLPPVFFVQPIRAGQHARNQHDDRPRRDTWPRFVL